MPIPCTLNFKTARSKAVPLEVSHHRYSNNDSLRTEWFVFWVNYLTRLSRVFSSVYTFSRLSFSAGPVVDLDFPQP